MSARKTRCAGCHAALAGTETFCRSCGTLAVRMEMACDEHPERPAGHRCIVCGRPLCAACRRSKGERSFCAAHVEMAEDWVTSRVVRSSFVADILERNLELNGMDARSFDHGLFSEGSGTDEAVLVWVRASECETADGLLRRFGLD
jgi:hypothetical protein